MSKKRPAVPSTPLTLVGSHPSFPGVSAPPHAKILGLDALVKAREEARARGLALVQCHGCFDIVHPGHIRHLRHAKAQGDLLLVSITGDSGINKGAGRPLIPEELRAENLAALDFVDFVHIDHHPTAQPLLEAVKPDIYVKGREYELNDDPRFKAERETVQRHGGRVFFSSGDVVFSSTALIAAIEHSADPYHARLKELLATPALDGVELAKTIGRFRDKRVLVVGETILDTYILCDRPEIASESPVMTLRPIERRQYDGGAAIVARHLAAMGARPVLLTTLPACHESTALKQRLAAEGVEVRSVECQSLIPEKQRFLVGVQKAMKLDLVERIELDAAAQEELVSLAAQTAGEEETHAAIIADYGLGMLSPGVITRLCAELRKRCGVLTAGVSGRRAGVRRLRGLDLLVASEHDLRETYHLHDEGLGLVAWNLLREINTRSTLVSMGADGVIGFTQLGEPGRAAPERAKSHEDGMAHPVSHESWQTRCKAEHVPAMGGTHLIDPLGSSDAMLAAATLTLTMRDEGSVEGLLPSAFLGSIAAATQAGRLGNTVVSASDLRSAVARIHTAHLTYAPPPAEVVASRRFGVTHIPGARAS